MSSIEVDPQRGPSDAGAGPRLDIATLTVVAYPDCGEAVLIRGHKQVKPEHLPRTKAERLGDLLNEIRRDEEGLSIKDPDRAAKESVRRSATRLRRFCTQHMLTRLGTLTFAEEPDLDGGWEAIETFRRRWEELALGPIAVVPQYGGRNGRLHFHVAIGRHVPKATLSALWGHGFVDIRKIRTKLGGRDSARAAAGYLAAYLKPAAAKDADGSVVEERDADHGHLVRAVGKHRRSYSVSKGHQVTVIRFVSLGIREAWDQALKLCGDLEVVWESSTAEDWRGPPTALLMGN